MSLGVAAARMGTKVVERSLRRDSEKPRVLVIGAGGLGCPVADLLAEARICTLVLSDGDIVDRSNLPRQWLYDEDDVGKPKAEAARARLLASWPGVAVEARGAWGARDALDGYALAIDGSDDV